VASNTLNPGVGKVEAWAWAMFDFANSGYTTVVITAVFNAYFVGRIAGNAAWASLAWTSALAVSYALIMVSAPALGAYADLRLAKKKLLLWTTLGCVAATVALGWVGPGDIWLAAGLVMVSNFFFGSGENIIAGFLPELARGRGMGRLSGWGWGLGYVGGLLTLGLCLAWVSQAQAKGQGADDFVPVTLWITSGMFLLAALPTFLFLKERGTPQAMRGHPVKDAYGHLLATLRTLRDYPDAARFLICIVFYQAGVQAVITLAAVYADQAMHFTTQQTILLVMVVNITAAVGALAFGHVQDRLGHKLSVALTLVGWLATVVLAWQATDATRFWIAANLAGLCMGTSQSAGRALVGYLSPLARRAEFFGLWGLAVKLSSILGPVTYGLAVWLTGGNYRFAMLTLAIYFVVGLAVLATVDMRRGRRRALKRVEVFA
jgi:UMF1 family MFS transporter